MNGHNLNLTSNPELKYQLYLVRFIELFNVVSVGSSIVDDFVVSIGISREVLISDAK